MKKTLKKAPNKKTTKKVNKQEQGVAMLPILIMVASVIAFAVMGYFVYKQMYPAKVATNTNVNATANTNVPANTNTITDATKDWETYRNEQYSYTLKYPPDEGVSSELGQTDIKTSDTIYAGILRVSPIDKEETTTLDAFLEKKKIVNADNVTVAGLPGKRILFPKEGTWNVLTGKEKAYDGLVVYPGNEHYLVNGPDYYFWFACQVSDTTIPPPTAQQFVECRSIIDTFQLSDQTATKDWKTYTNTKDGYLIQYPRNWRLDESSPVKEISYTPTGQTYGGDGDITVLIRKDENVTQTLREWFTVNKQLTAAKIQETMKLVKEGKTDVGPGYESQVYSSGDTAVSGLKAIYQYITATKPEYIEGPATTSRTYYVKRGSTIFSIEGTAPTGTKSEGLLATFDTMVGTFVLTDQTVTKGWKTYANDEFHYSFNYPSTWAVSSKSITDGTFALATALQTTVFEPQKNTLGFSAATRCTLQSFHADGKSVTDWVAQSAIYDDPADLYNILSKETLMINSVSGLNVVEGGENAQQTRSFYFLTKDGKNVLRFGYYIGADTRSPAEFEADTQVCWSILGSIQSVK